MFGPRFFLFREPGASRGRRKRERRACRANEARRTATGTAGGPETTRFRARRPAAADDLLRTCGAGRFSDARGHGARTRRLRGRLCAASGASGGTDGGGTRTLPALFREFSGGASAPGIAAERLPEYNAAVSQETDNRGSTARPPKEDGMEPVERQNEGRAFARAKRPSCGNVSRRRPPVCTQERRWNPFCKAS